MAVCWFTPLAVLSGIKRDQENDRGSFRTVCVVSCDTGVVLAVLSLSSTSSSKITWLRRAAEIVSTSYRQRTAVASSSVEVLVTVLCHRYIRLAVTLASLAVDDLRG